MNSKLLAKDIMTKSVLTVSESQTLAEVWKILSENRITGAPVVDEDGALIGVISQTDILRETAVEAFEKFPSGLFYMEFPHFEGSYWPVQPDVLHEITVGEVMNSEPICTDISTDIPGLAAMMRHHRIHRILITEKGSLAGIVSTMDMIKTLEMQ